MTPGINNSSKIRVETEVFKYPERDYTFLQDFRIGRRDDAEVCIKDEFVSRYHAEVVFDNGKWWVRDLGSSNGIFVDGVQVQSKQIEDTLSVRLGVEGEGSVSSGELFEFLSQLVVFPLVEFQVNLLQTTLFGTVEFSLDQLGNVSQIKNLVPRLRVGCMPIVARVE